MNKVLQKGDVFIPQDEDSISVKLKRRLSKIGKNFANDYCLYLMLVPFLAFFIIFLYKPMYGIQIAFKDYSIFKGIDGSPWIGLENFKTFFAGPYFIRILKNTLMISLYSLCIGFPIPIIMALLFNEVRNKTFKTFGQTITYLPYFISAVVVAGMVTNFLAPNNGLVNIIIEKLGGEKVYFLTKPEWFRSIYISMTVWKEAGFNAVIYIAALAAIDVELYEAARIDGANRWKQVLFITIPSIMPTIIIMLILRIGRLLEVGYETIILLYQPATYETADVISTYVYRAGIVEGNYEMAVTAGLFNAVVAVLLVFISNKISKKFSETSIW